MTTKTDAQQVEAYVDAVVEACRVRGVGDDLHIIGCLSVMGLPVAVDYGYTHDGQSVAFMVIIPKASASGLVQLLELTEESAVHNLGSLQTRLTERLLPRIIERQQGGMET